MSVCVHSSSRDLFSRGGGGGGEGMILSRGGEPLVPLNEMKLGYHSIGSSGE